MPLLRAPRTIDPVFVLDACRRLFPASVVGEVSGDDPFTFEFDGCAVAVAGMPIAIPEGEAEHAGEVSILWQDAAEDLEGYGAHAVVFVSGDDHRRCCIVAQRAIAAVVDATDALGVYVGDAGHLVRADVWTDLVREAPDELLGQLWFRALAGPGDDGRAEGFTRGLAAFGLPELEIVGSRQPASEVWSFIGDIALYLLENGDVIQDGHTVGATAEQKIVARAAPSRFGTEGRVLQLSF